MIDLDTHARNDWCPGCGNFGILNAVKAVLAELNDEGLPLSDVVLVSGIGQHAKIADYLNVNSFYSIHGRVAPAAEAIKLANPRLKVIGFAGDGDAYGEGIEHLIFAAKRNIDLTMVIHNNRVYALTTGQYTPTSPLGFKGRSTPAGSKEKPMNPLEIMLACGATYLARSYSANMAHLKKTLKEAILHKGFALVDVLQVCVTFFDLYDHYGKHIYELRDHDPASFDAACREIAKWDYNSDAPISIGTFYKKESQRFDQVFYKAPDGKIDRESGIREILKNYV